MSDNTDNNADSFDLSLEEEQKLRIKSRVLGSMFSYSLMCHHTIPGCTQEEYADCITTVDSRYNQELSTDEEEPVTKRIKLKPGKTIKVIDKLNSGDFQTDNCFLLIVKNRTKSGLDANDTSRAPIVRVAIKGVVFTEVHPGIAVPIFIPDGNLKDYSITNFDSKNLALIKLVAIQDS